MLPFSSWLRQTLVLVLTLLGSAGGGTPRDDWSPTAAAWPAAAAAGAPAVTEQRQEIPRPETEPPSPLSRKQRKDLLKSNIEKMKHDADELVALTKSLQQEIHASNENVLSLKIVETAEKIEKLARKIRNAARGQ